MVARDWSIAYLLSCLCMIDGKMARWISYSYFCLYPSWGGCNTKSGKMGCWLLTASRLGDVIATPAIPLSVIPLPQLAERLFCITRSAKANNMALRVSNTVVWSRLSLTMIDAFCQKRCNAGSRTHVNGGFFNRSTDGTCRPFSLTSWYVILV